MTAKLETLVDAFTGTSVDAVKWGHSSGGGVYSLDTANDLVKLNVGTSASSFVSFGAGQYDATGSYVFARVGAAPNGDGNVTTSIILDCGSNNTVSLKVARSAFTFTVKTNGTPVSLTLPTYDANAHRWWKLSEAGGTFYAATSPDGYVWTTLGSLTYSFSATSCAFYLQTGTSTAQVSGLFATISNVNTMAGGPLNPNWPRAEYAWGPMWNANAGTVPADRYVNVTDRTNGSLSTQRGKQYELDAVQAGTATTTLINTDGALDPTNVSGPWAGHIAPYQPLRARMQYPATLNLLTPVQATGGDGLSAGAIPADEGVLSITDPSGGQVVASTTAYGGGNVFQMSVTSGAAGRICYTAQAAAEPGQTYTVQMRVRNVTASTSLPVKAFLSWYGPVVGAGATFTYGTPVTLTGAATAWTYITATFTVPASAYGIACGVTTDGVPSSTCSVQVDGWQLETGAVASLWECPGTPYPLYAGFVERWPSTWALASTFGVVTPTAVDSLALLSQRQLSDALTEEANKHTPRFVYKLDDPSGSTVFADSTGNYPAAPAVASKYGPGVITAGTSITATDPVNGIFTGAAGPVVNVNNTYPGTNTIGPASYISLTPAGIAGPADPTTFTRTIAFRYTGPLPTGTYACIWSAQDMNHGNNALLYFVIMPDGTALVESQGSGGGGNSFSLSTPVNVADGNWHMVTFSLKASTSEAWLTVDGTTRHFTAVAAGATPTGLVGDNVGTFVDIGNGGGTYLNFAGDIAFVAEFPALLTAADAVNLYTAWKNAFTGDSSDARYARLLGWAGYTGASAIDVGQTRSMGPVSNSGTDALSALQAVVDTENGAHYVDASGALVFKSRAARYNALTPVFTFGEDEAGGELPYEDIALDFDPTHLGNSVTITQAATNQTFTGVAMDSQANYFTRSLSRTVDSSSALECQDAANYLISRYRNPLTRISTLHLHPSANPALWAACLSLELGTRIRVVRRPFGAPPITVDAFVESIQWDLADTNEAFVTLQCSPIDATPYGLLASWHTTLNAQASSGTASLTINASADNTNLLASQVGPGQTLTLEPGTANAETVTVAAVGTTSPGWTTATLTLTANLTKTHAASAVLCEPLPTGVTNPTTYDGNAFDSVAFVY